MFDKENNNENKDKKNRILRRTLKILKWACITFVSIIVLSLIIRAIGVSNNNKVPDGGINESMYITINKSKQWINIYGQNINNPVILYLHGGPGAATSLIDYKFLRKWSDIYTIVTWDQRNTGLSYSDDQNNTEITYDMLMEDGVEVTKFIMSYLNKDKITLIGHSWGTYYGSNLSLKHPEFYDYYIGTGQLVDAYQTEEALIKAAKEWSKGDPEGEKLVSKMDANNLDPEYFKIRAKVMDRYKEYQGNDEPDYNVLGAVFFNPYYSIIDTFKFLFGGFDQKVYEDFTKSPELDKFSLLNQTEYKIPYYNILGDHDYDTNHFQAEDYFNAIKAPRKKLYIMKDMGHGTFSVRSGEFSDIMHEIAKLEQNEQHNNINNNTTTTATTTTNNNNSSNNSTVAINNNNNSSNNSTVTINNNNNNNKNNSTITIN